VSDAAPLRPGDDHGEDAGAELDDEERATTVEVTVDEVIENLLESDLEIVGRMPYSSNATFLVKVVGGSFDCQAIYKPVKGERDLWDFPPGLHKREVAAFVLSDELGWHCIPPTVVRGGPHGEGSVQLFIPADFREHHFTLVEEAAHHDQLRTLCAFDLLANNTDRKSGHCLLGLDGKIWGIDQGLCFSAEFKLRTVIWEFAGEPIPARLVAGIAEVARCPPERLHPYLTARELDAMQERARYLVRNPFFPSDESGYRHPWPLI
jgi:uncharacterized repeat protein (TIGR03843 family)